MFGTVRVLRRVFKMTSFCMMEGTADSSILSGDRCRNLELCKLFPCTRITLVDLARLSPDKRSNRKSIPRRIIFKSSLFGLHSTLTEHSFIGNDGRVAIVVRFTFRVGQSRGSQTAAVGRASIEESSPLLRPATAGGGHEGGAGWGTQGHVFGRAGESE